MTELSSSGSSLPVPLPRARRRRRNPWPSVLGVGALLLLAGWLAYGSLGQSLEYFKTPSEYQMEQAQLGGRMLRLGGLVQHVQYDPQSMNLRFDITDGSVTYPVQYTGGVSEMFREGQGVVVRGRFQGEAGAGGIFQATELIVKHSEEYRVPENQADIDRLKHELQTEDTPSAAGPAGRAGAAQ